MIGRTTCEYCQRRVRVTNNGDMYRHVLPDADHLDCRGSGLAVDYAEIAEPKPKPREIVGCTALGEVVADDATWWQRNYYSAIRAVALAVVAFAFFALGLAAGRGGVPWR